MRNWLILLLCFVLGNAHHTKGRRVTMENCGISNDIQPRIVGGVAVKEGFFPWIVTLHENYDVDFKHICGGTILNRWWIITAAHCIENPDKPHVYEIYVGLHRLSQKSAARVARHPVALLVKHENYTGSDYHNDIALIRTATPIDFGGSEGYVNGICLPDKGEQEHHSVAMIAGWGHTQEGAKAVSDVLRTVTVPVITREECHEAYISEQSAVRHDITDNMICAGVAGIDSCQADSGGPLVMWKHYRATLYGVVSFGNGCGNEGYPGVYTKVSAYIDWITEKIFRNGGI